MPSVAGFGVPSEIDTVGSAWSSMMLPVPSASVIASGSLLVSSSAAERWTVNASGRLEDGVVEHRDGDDGGGGAGRDGDGSRRSRR